MITLKTKMVNSKEGTANNHLPSAEKILGERIQMHPFAYSISILAFLVVLFLFFEQAYQYLFQLKVTIHYSFKYSKTPLFFHF